MAANDENHKPQEQRNWAVDSFRRFPRSVSCKKHSRCLRYTLAADVSHAVERSQPRDGRRRRASPRRSRKPQEQNRSRAARSCFQIVKAADEPAVVLLPGTRNRSNWQQPQTPTGNGLVCRVVPTDLPPNRPSSSDINPVYQ
jgi:hypothetical protein